LPLTNQDILLNLVHIDQTIICRLAVICRSREGLSANKKEGKKFIE